MTGRLRWLTHDTLPGLACRAVFYPGSSLDLADLLGAIQELGNPNNWEQQGEKTPEETAYAWELALWQTVKRESCMPIGMVLWLAHSSVPDYCLPCDGSLYDPEEYPALFEAIGYTFDAGEGGTFGVPDLRGMVVLGIGEGNYGGDYAIGDNGGEIEHDLQTSEIPSHHHGIHAHGPVPGLFVSPGEVPASIPWLFGGDTDNTGGGDAHNNMPPYLALMPVIVAK